MQVCDIASLKHEAHALKGASALLGMQALADACMQLEEIHSADQQMQIEELVPEIERRYEKAVAELASLRVV
jgi:HPt (histidine-containing phosphotransfer) domain-containing protein